MKIEAQKKVRHCDKTTIFPQVAVFRVAGSLPHNTLGPGDTPNPIKVQIPITERMTIDRARKSYGHLEVDVDEKCAA